MNDKSITVEFLVNNDFKIQKNGSYKLEIKNVAFHSVNIYVEIISPVVGEFVSLQVGKGRQFATIPVDSDVRLNNLIQALKGQ